MSEFARVGVTTKETKFTKAGDARAPARAPARAQRSGARIRAAWIDRFGKGMATLPNRPCCRHASNRECRGYMTLKRTTPAVSRSPWSYIC
jgi:hypothetical protein